MSCLVFLAFILTCLSCTCSARRDIQWKKLDSYAVEGLARFDDTDYSFPVNDNLVHCRKKIIRIPLEPGVLDYGPKIQDAFNELVKNSNKDDRGGTVMLDEGVYWQQTQFEIPSYCCLQGAGMYKTTLKVHKEAPPFPKAGAIRTVYTERVSVFDLTQDGNRDELPGEPQNRFGIYTHLTNYMWMKNLRILNNKWYGFDPHGANTAWSYFLVMEDCYSAHNGKDGYTIDQYYYVSLLNSVAVDNDRHGINIVSGSRYVLIKGNRALRNANCGLTVQNNEFGTQSTRFVENIAADYGLAGICVRNTRDVQAVRNKLYSPKQGAALFQLQVSDNVTLANNEWVKNSKKYRFTGESDYIEYATKVSPDTPSARQAFMAQFANIDDPPKATVDLTDKLYGTAKADNHVPKGPRRLTFRKSPPKTYESRVRTHNQLNDKKSNNPADSDPLCERGILNVGLLSCCPEHCGKCEARNCATMADPKCCPASIRTKFEACDTHGPPCYMSRKHTAPGRTYGSNDRSSVEPVKQEPAQPAKEKPSPTPAAKEAKKTVEKPVKTDPKATEKRKEKNREKKMEKKTKKSNVDDDDDDEKPRKPKKKSIDSKSKLIFLTAADPTCKHGVRNSKTCCPKLCGRCGGRQCSKLGPNKMCCQSEIRKTGRMCKSAGAPCVIRF